ncbi:MAG: TRAP transporter small permease [Lachnospiraceae bacterium]|nr:TRAP transporter small permease [Lachnospiraceae bacterium]
MPAAFEKLEKIKPVYDAVYNGATVLCKILLIADILIVSFQVAGRYIPFIPDPSWTEQVVLTLMSYMAVLSAALAIRRGAHIRMTAFDRYLPEKLLKVLDIVADIAVLILAVIMIVEGWKYALVIGGRGNYESMPWLSRFWMYFPVPLAGIAMIIFELEAIYNHIKSFYTDKESNPGQSKPEKADNNALAENNEKAGKGGETA